MSQTMHQEQEAAAAQPKARKDWELFWRIVAGLMLLVIAWVAWVLYQISPRSVVTPLAYSGQTTTISTQEAAAARAPAEPTPAAPAPAPEPSAADRAMALAQEAAGSGAHQASADVQAAALQDMAAAPKPEPALGEGLKLATEISIPPAAQQRVPKTQEGKPDGASAVPAATDARGKDRP